MTTTIRSRLYEVEDSAPHATCLVTVQAFAQGYNSNNGQSYLSPKSNKKDEFPSLSPISCKEIDETKLNQDMFILNRHLDFEVEENLTPLRMELQSSDVNIIEFIRQNDFSIKLVEDVLLLVDTILPIMRNKAIENKFKTISKIIFLWFKGRSSKSAALMLTENEFFNKLVNKLISELRQDDTQLQSFDVEWGINSAKDLMDKFTSFKESAIYKKLYKIILYALTHSVFDKMGLTLDFLGYSMFQQEAMKKKYHLGCDFIHILLDTIIFIAQKGYQIIKTRSFDCVFHSSKTYEEFHANVLILKRQFTCLNNPEAHGFNEFDFRRNLDDLIEKGESIIKFNNVADAFEKKVLVSYLNELMTMKTDLCTKSAARESRSAPYSILICGDSGIGKSTIKDMLFTHFGKVNNLNIDSTYCYTRNPVAKFWDGFTTSQWAVILDDVAFMHPNKAPSGDPSVMEFLQIINAVPFTPDQADLSDKGRTPLRARLCIATTNTEDLNAHYYFSCASAAQRRFPYIVVPTVKREFCKEGTNMLDSSKTVNIDGSYPDFWDWTVKRVDPIPLISSSVKAKIEIIHDKISLKNFLIWYNTSIKDFNTNQQNVKESVAKLSSIALCDQCHLTSNYCECMPLQRFDVDLGNLISRLLVSIFLTVIKCVLLSPTLCKLLYNIGFSEYVSNGIHNQLRASVMRRLGNRASISIGYPAALATLCVSVGVLITLYKTYKIFDVQSSDTETMPVGDDKKENVWYKNDFVLSPMDFTPTSKSSKGSEPNKIQDIIFKSVICIGVTIGKNKIRKGKAFCLKGQLYLTNNHIIPIIPDGETRQVYLTLGGVSQGVNENQTVLIDESCIARFAQGDIIVVRLPIVNRKGLLDYIPDNEIQLRHNGFYVSRSESGGKEILDVNRIRSGNMSQYSFEDINYLYKEIMGLASAQTYDGFCGSPLIAITDFGFSIVGMHVRGDTNSTTTIVSVPLNKKIILCLISRFSQQFDEGVVLISSPSVQKSVESLHKKSAMRYIQAGTATVVGSYVGFRPHHKSRVESTPMAPLLPYITKFGAPKLTGWEPWYAAAKDLTNPITDYKPAVMEKVFRSFLKDIKSNLSKQDLQMLQVYNDFTAINGAAKVRFVDKVNRNTSAGLPWRKSKRFFMKAYDCEMFELPDAVSVDKEIMDRVDFMTNEYLQDRTTHPVTCGSLKDEPRKPGKNARLFNGAPMDFVILMRKYYLSSVRLIQNKQYAFEAAPGIIAQSIEWDDMYKYITKFGDSRIIAGDYAAYDKRMISDFILKAFQILIELSKESGNFSADDLKIMSGISYDIAFPMIDLNGDLLRLWCSNPSGHPLTVIINCLVNSLYMRYVYHELNPEGEVESFKSNVSLMCYGDDNIMSVSPSINWFSHTTIQDCLGNMGITYTMAEKEEASRPFIHISEATFLKRRWRFDNDVGYFLGPLEVESIEKSLVVWTRSKSVSKEEQGIDIISSACCEWWFHGKDKFLLERSRLMKLVEDLGWTPWIKESTFPTWDEIHYRFRFNSDLVPSSDIPIQGKTVSQKKNLSNINKKLNIKMNEFLKRIEAQAIQEVPIGGTLKRDDDCSFEFVEDFEFDSDYEIIKGCDI